MSQQPDMISELSDDMQAAEAVKAALGIDEPEKAKAESDVDESAEEVEAQEAETETQDETGEQETDEAESETEEITSLSDLAQHYELDENALFGLKVKTKQGEAALKDLVDSYQLLGTVHNKSREVSEARKALEKEAEQLKTDYQAKVKEVDTTFQVLAATLAGKWQGKNLQELDQDEMLEYQKDQMTVANAFKQLEKIQQQQKAEQDKQVEKFKIEESERLLSVFPEWTDETKAQTAGREISEFLKGFELNGQTIAFSKEEVAELADHRYLAVVHMAMQYHKLQQKAPTVNKKVRKAPTNLKAKQQNANAKDKADAELMKKAKSGDEKALQRILAESFKMD